MSNTNNTISQNFSSESPSPQKIKKSNPMKSSMNLQLYENERPSYFNLNKSISTSKKTITRHQWSLKRDEIIVKEIKIKKSLLVNKLQSASYDSIVHLFRKNRKNVRKINFIIFIIDLLTISLINICYIMFIKNDSELNMKINILRMISAFFSIINSVLIIIRLFLLKDNRLMKYILNIRLTYPSNNINHLKAFSEVFIHLIFPYPFISFKNSIYNSSKNLNTVYTSDMFLLILSFLRLYTFFRLFLLTVDFRSIRLWKLFNNKRLLLFEFRCIIQSHPIITYLILMIVFVIICTYFFQILENLEDNEKKINFSNSFWLLSQTIVNCGFGDYQIKTSLTRILVTLVIIFGLHFSISFILSILSSFEYQTENEIKAYHQIKLVYSKNQKNTSYSIYFEHYLKYKLIKMKDSLKSHKKNNDSNVLQKFNISLALKVPLYHDKDNMLFKILNLKNNLKIIKERYYSNVLAKLKVDPTFNDFFNYIKNKFDVRIRECIYKTEKNLENIISYHNFFCENISEYYHNVVETYYQSNRITNLILLIYWTGARFNIKDFDDLVKYKVIGIKEFDLKYREFRLIFYSRVKRKKYLGVNNSDIKLSRISRESFANKLDEYYDEYDSDYDDFEDFEVDDEFEEYEGNDEATSCLEKSSNGASMTNVDMSN